MSEQDWGLRAMSGMDELRELDASQLSDADEVANVITHGLGFLLSLFGAGVLAASVLWHVDVWRVTACFLYAGSLVGVYGMSTLSHTFTTRELRRLFRALDQGFIYLLIVATYTPFSVVYLRTPGWWAFLAVMWTLAVAGFLSKVFFAHRLEGVSVWIYVALGWMPIVSATSVIGVVPDLALWWMLIGGLCYTFGTVFLIFDNRVLYFHAIWHLLVIAGSACHFFAILLFVAQAQ